MEKTNEVLKIFNLAKTFSNGKIAVDDLSLTIYKN